MITLVESAPSSDDTIAKGVRWIQDLTARADDVRGLWKSWTPDLMRSIKSEFSESNPNQWAALTPAYRKWKVSHKRPATIGVSTGALREAAGEQAVIKYDKKYLLWSINESVSSGTWGSGKAEVGEYMGYFEERRPIFGATVEYIKSAARKIFEMVTKGFIK
jgi:hypothetical protein